MGEAKRTAAQVPTPGPWLVRGEAGPEASPENVMLRVEPAREDRPGSWPYFIHPDRAAGPGDVLLHIATGIQRSADATLLAAAPALAEALFRLLTAPTLLDRPLDPETRVAVGAGWALLVRAAPHLRIGADPPGPTSPERAAATDDPHHQREPAMDDHDDDIRQLARYGSGLARLYLWVWICVCYVWVSVGLIGGVLVMDDGSTVFGAGMIVLGLIAFKVAGYLMRLKNGDG